MQTVLLGVGVKQATHAPLAGTACGHYVPAGSASQWPKHCSCSCITSTNAHPMVTRCRYFVVTQERGHPWSSVSGQHMHLKSGIAVSSMNLKLHAARDRHCCHHATTIPSTIWIADARRYTQVFTTADSAVLGRSSTPHLSPKQAQTACLYPEDTRHA